MLRYASKSDLADMTNRSEDAKEWRVANGRGKALLERVYDRPAIGVEVGVNLGYLSKHLLLMRQRLTLVMVDLWIPSKAHRTPRKSAEKRTYFARNRRMIVQDDSAKASWNFPDKTFDFVFIDADHTEEAVTLDILAWKDKVRPGGVLCGHDIDMPGVRAAVEAQFGDGAIEGLDATWFKMRNW